MKYTVTGASGHLGINIVESLIRENKHVIAFDMHASTHFVKSPYL